MPEQDSINPYQAPLATDARPRPEAVEWLGSRSVSLSRVALGLGIIYAGIIVTVLAVIGGIAGIRLLQDHDMIALFAAGMVLVAGIGTLLNVVGSCLCLATPEETGARGLIQMSVGAMLAALVFGIADGAEILPTRLHFIESVMQLIAGVNFLRYLGQLGRFIGRRDLARRARSIFVWCGILFVLFIVAIVVAANQPGPVGVAAIVIVAGGWLILFVSYVNLIAATRKAILSGGPAA